MPPAALVAYCAARAALLACLMCLSYFYSYGSYGSHSLYRSYSYGSHSYGSGVGCGSDNTLLTCDAGTVMLSTGCDDSTCGNCSMTMNYTAYTDGLYTCEDSYQSHYSINRATKRYLPLLGCFCDKSNVDGCFDTDIGVEDSNGANCVDYTNPASCGGLDDSDFSANAMCCACGGGLTDGSPTDYSYGTIAAEADATGVANALGPAIATPLDKTTTAIFGSAASAAAEGTLITDAATAEVSVAKPVAQGNIEQRRLQDFPAPTAVPVPAPTAEFCGLGTRNPKGTVCCGGYEECHGNCGGAECDS